MKLKFLSLIFLPSLILADNFHNQLIIPSVNIDNPLWEFSYQPIAEKEDGAFAELVEKWDNLLDDLWEDLSQKIQEDMNISIEVIDYYMNDQRFVDAYMNYYKKYYADFINFNQHDEDIDANVLNFIHLKLNYLQFHQPININIVDDFDSLAMSFGTNRDGHFLILSENMYNNENIQNLYTASMDKIPKYFIEPHTNFHKSRIIEVANLFHLDMSKAVSTTLHQTDYFSKFLLFFTYNNIVLSEKIQKSSIEYLLFQSFLECCLQSKNPLEAALFLEPQMDNMSQPYILLWRNFISDIENCYDPNDLAAYESLSLRERRAILFTEQD